MDCLYFILTPRCFPEPNRINKDKAGRVPFLLLSSSNTNITKNNIIMALFKITVKMSKHCDGMVIEPGMSIQYASMFSNILSNNQEREKINSLFFNHFGVDLKKMNALTPAYLIVEKI